MSISTDLMFFEVLRTAKPPIPLLPFDEKRRLRVADGVTLFGLSGAAAVSGQTEQYLRDLWIGTWGQIWETDDDNGADTAHMPPRPEPFDSDGVSTGVMYIGRMRACLMLI